MPLRRSLFAATTALALVSAAGAGAAPLATRTVKGASVEGITEYALPNGMRILLVPDPSKPTVTVNVTYFVGSRHESYGETGMAHLLEHLMFKGTPKTPDVPQALSEHGANANGTTWFDRTNYYATLPSTDANLEWMLRFEADRMVHSKIAKADLDSEMTVVRNELEIGENDPWQILVQRVLSTAYLWHNYGHDTIGARSDLEGVPIERLRAFYERYYQPDNALLVVAGKLDEARTLRWIEDSFGRIPRPKRALSSLWTVEPTQDGEREVTLRRAGGIQGLVAVYHVPAGSHEDFAAVDVLADILGRSPSGRLHRALVEPRKAASVMGGGYQLREPGVLMFGAEVRKEQPLNEVRTLFLDTIEGLPAHPPSAEEVERSRTALLKDIELTLNSSERVGIQLSEWAAIGDWRMLFIHRDRLRKVTPADVQRAAARYLKPSNRTLGTFVPTDKPDRTEIPAAPDIAALVKDYRGDKAVAAGEAFDASPANIDARTRRGTLPGGLEMALLPKRTRGETVNAYLALRFGTEQSLASRRVAAELAARMLMRGTRKHTREQLKDELDRLKARVHISGGPTGVAVSLETVRGSLPEVLRLVTEVLREPAFAAKELEELRQASLADIEAQKLEPNTLGFRTLSRRVNPLERTHPAYVPLPEEELADLKAVRLEDVRAFHGDFYGASHGQIALVGDFDPDATAGLLGELLGGWKSPRPYERIPNPYREIAAVQETIHTPDKANAVLAAGQVLSLRDDDPDYPALVLADYLLGGGFLNSRLATRIRQKEGLSYGVGSQLRASSQDRRSLFAAYAFYAPQNAARVEAALREELERAIQDGFTPGEVTKGKAGLLQERTVARAQDAGLATTLANCLYLDRTLAFDADLDRKIGALTPAQVQKALRRHLDPAKMVVIKAGDLGGSKAAPAPGGAAPAHP